ncbi:MAG: FadR family transcriptional regulator [Eubacteriaceae bacterium]|jgi:GntR family transcriptional repressor for pyruvate dehydrogenase complex|nr:FadR family transcriptional regulator [Eubacteriaceae bacterium]
MTGCTADSDKAYEKVVRYIKNKIIAGELKLGSKLPPERNIAEELGLSRNSVREGIHMLKIMGFVSSQQGAGNYVACNLEENITESLSIMFTLNKMDYMQLNDLRLALESEAFTLAVDNITDEEITAMKGYIEKLEENISEEENVQWDKKIHFALADASKNMMIQSILSSLSDVFDMFMLEMRKEVLKGPDREHLQEAHRDIVACLAARDKKGGRDAIRRHFTYIRHALEATERKKEG